MQDIVQQLANIDTRRATLRRDQFEESPHAGGSGESTILSYKADQPVALRPGGQYRLVPVARESFTTDGSGSTQTFSLGHDLIDSDVSDNLVLFADGSRVTADAVDYAGDSFDYTDDGATQNLVAYYVAATQASVKIKKVAPGGSNSETLVEHDAALINRRDPNKDPLEFQLSQSPLQGTIPKDYRLEVTIDAPYSSGRDPDVDPVPSNLLVSIPINRATVAEVEGLSSAVARDTSNRV